MCKVYEQSSFSNEVGRAFLCLVSEGLAFADVDVVLGWCSDSLGTERNASA